MASSPVKGVDAFLARRRLVLRAVCYTAIFMMAVVNLGMISSTWSNTRFMRDNGALTGAFSIASSLATLIISGLLATAAVLDRQAQMDGRPPPPLSERLGQCGVDQLISTGMAAWWLAQALLISNTVYIFREEIGRCTARKLPRSHLLPGVSAAASATACTVLRGSLALTWMLFVAWSFRAWRAFTRATAHFDSTIFREPSESMLDLRALKVNGNVPITFSPHYPGEHRISRAPPQQVLRTRELHNDKHIAAQQHLSGAPVPRPIGPGMCQCAGCPMSFNRIQMPTHEVVANEATPDAATHYRHQPEPPAASEVCCQHPTVGTAMLLTEPVAATPFHHHHYSHETRPQPDPPSSQLHQWTADVSNPSAAHPSAIR
ncbi:hypothetical protein IWW38_000368 [Coemansia aciculifera]|uniref:Uncharacterized protein n=1 Tax=Coemansia aciculifera TaxID=417176 RepID=A0ACC1MA90_9FUNG|nr:hypothetical protein IWW38_000368 [Coemansia aciculifera]